MELKSGYKTSEFWGKVIAQILIIFGMFFPDANLNPDIGFTLIGLLETFYNAGRVVVKRKQQQVEEKKIELQQKQVTVSGALAGSKAFKMILVATLSAAMMFSACSKKPIDEGTVFAALQGVSAGYNFAHEAITKFAQIAAHQIELSCPKDPTGPLCKGARSFQKLYEDKLYPGSVDATALWNDLMEAFDIYRQMENPNEEAIAGILAKIEALEKAINALKLLFAGVQVGAGPVSFEVIQALDYVAWETEKIKSEVLAR